MKEIPLNARVNCSDGDCGEIVTLIVDPTTQVVTHIVVATMPKRHDTQRLVAVDLIVRTSRDLIELRCTEEELVAMVPFIQERYVQYAQPEYSDTAGYYGYEMPYVTPMEPTESLAEIEMVPAGELAVHRGMKVDASDGHIGTLDELLLDPDSGHISHLVLVKGHLWGKKEVTIPITDIDFTQDDVIYLSIDKQQIKHLPSIPVKRHYRG